VRQEGEAIVDEIGEARDGEGAPQSAPDRAFALRHLKD